MAASATHAELAVLETSINERIQGLEQRLVESINASVSTFKEQLGSLVTEGWTAANVELTREQSAVPVLLEEMKFALEATSTDGLQQAAAKIKSIDVDREAEKVCLSILRADMTTRLHDMFQRVFSQVGVLEAKIADGPRGVGDYDGGSAPNSRAPRLRLLDPSGWKLKEVA